MANKLKKFSENYFPYAGWMGNNGDFYFSLARGTDEHIKENILKRGGKLIGIEHVPASLTWKERSEAADAAKAKLQEQYEQMTEHKDFSAGQIVHLKFKTGWYDFKVARPATQRDFKEYGGCDAKIDFTNGEDWGVGEDWKYMYLEGIREPWPAIVGYKGKWPEHYKSDYVEF